MSYDNYYTGSDVFLYIQSKESYEQIYLDKLYGFSYQEMTTATPIYGLGDSEFGFISKGNTLMRFAIDVNMIHEKYMVQAINAATANKSGIPLARYTVRSNIGASKLIETEAISRRNKLDINAINKMSVAQLSAAYNSTSNNDAGMRSYLGNPISKLHELPKNFSLKVIFNNSTPLEPDSRASSFEIFDCVTTGRESESYIDKDGQLIQRYNFYGKYR